MYVVSSIAVIVSLAIGLLLGTAYNHSVDIPWWIFSILSFIIIVLPSIVVLGILRIRLFILRKYKS
ncbi:hypothetical protein M4I21_01640 [Cellulophaga sp. 20_2_10]|uniref:hypothetical protein n=1 Tax=Cellulophaga sp. 20_2_10 TaxID=2942476 RepID=UPI00201B1F76|nr:hypothetical protein [Cellulophaga sp. 20_2_10]MCL5244490.1 hypothetical protein [Cellulophaga sp. 20_2_10]